MQAVNFRLTDIAKMIKNKLGDELEGIQGKPPLLPGRAVHSAASVRDLVKKWRKNHKKKQYKNDEVVQYGHKHVRKENRPRRIVRAKDFANLIPPVKMEDPVEIEKEPVAIEQPKESESKEIIKEPQEILEVKKELIERETQTDETEEIKYSKEIQVVIAPQKYTKEIQVECVDSDSHEELQELMRERSELLFKIKTMEEESNKAQDEQKIREAKLQEELDRQKKLIGYDV